MSASPPLERRFTTSPVELRRGSSSSSAGTGDVVRGYAAVFNKRSQKLFEPRLGPFIEQIRKGAFAKTIKETDVRALVNHDPNLLLGRSSSGTLRVGEDNVGLWYEVDLPDTTYGRDLGVSLQRKDITQSSFSFGLVGADGDSWSTTEDGFPLRTLNELRVGDVSPVTYPAYLDSTSGIGQIDPALSAVGGPRAIVVDNATRRLDLMRRRRPGVPRSSADPADVLKLNQRRLEWARLRYPTPRKDTR